MVGQSMMTQKLDEITKLTSELTYELREEILKNAKLCVEFRKDIQYLRETINDIKSSTIGVGSSSMINRLGNIEHKIITIEDNINNVENEISNIVDNHRKNEEKTKDRIWRFIIGNSSIIIIWIGAAVYVLIKFLITNEAE